ncbi:MAG TPA: hypothetical protein VKV25_10695 [Acidimicrobiales bacterium]|nr:hypothetical protein [Acidimicrobiales bacterium]
MTRPPVLLVGSFPPVSTAGAAVALEVARELWAAGEDVVTVSPRASAARMTVSVSGPLAGRRLEQVRLATGARRLVLCAERDFPVPADARPPSALSVVQQATVRRLAAAMAAFEHVTLIACGDVGLAPPVWEALARVATEVRSRPDARGVAGITPRGPSEITPADLAAKGLSVAARRLLGPRAPEARAVAARWAHRARAARSRLG